MKRNSTNSKLSFDKKTLELLNLLEEEGRLSIRKIAKRLSMKPSSVFNRIKKLENEGIIEKYSAIVSREKIGYNVIGFVLVSYKKSVLSQEELAEKLKKYNQILEIHIIAGQWDILLKIVEKDVKSLGEFITKTLREIPEIDKTETLIVLKSIKENQNIKILN
ncbi:MAG: Lrp/AsnC family transcriptional regulator [Candidatus Woesearchaeota archaeon]